MLLGGMSVLFWLDSESPDVIGKDQSRGAWSAVAGAPSLERPAFLPIETDREEVRKGVSRVICLESTPLSDHAQKVTLKTGERPAMCVRTCPKKKTKNAREHGMPLV